MDTLRNYWNFANQLRSYSASAFYLFPVLALSEEILLKRFCLKFLLLLVSIGVTQFLLIGFGDPFRLYENATRFKNKFRIDRELASGANLLFFGDSVINFPALDDYDGNKSIAARLQHNLGRKWRVANASQPSFGPEVFYRWLQLLIRKGSVPKYVVVPINLRSFSPDWIYNYGWQHTIELQILSYDDNLIYKVFFNFINSFGAFSPHGMSKEQLDKISHSYPSADQILHSAGSKTNLGQEKSTEEQIELEGFARSYMLNVEPSNPNLLALKEIASLSDKHSLKCVFYFTPIDLEEAELHIGSAFERITRSNIELIEQVIRKASGSKVLNLAFSLKHEKFNRPKSMAPNEHLTEEGKQWVANQLANSFYSESIISH